MESTAKAARSATKSFPLHRLPLIRTYTCGYSPDLSLASAAIAVEVPTSVDEDEVEVDPPNPELPRSEAAFFAAHSC